MQTEHRKRKILMTGPAASVQGGMRTVVNQYLSSEHWKAAEIRYIPTYVEASYVEKLLFFGIRFLQIIFVGLIWKPDVLHMHVSERGSFWRKAILLRLFRKFGVKTVLHHHGAEFFPFYEGASAWKRKYIEQTIEMTDVNLVLSSYHLGLMKDRFSQGNFKVLYNAIEPENGNIYDPDATGILFVGRLGERKGTYDLIEALSDLEDKLPSEIKVYFCGDGEVEKVKKLLEEKNLSHRAAHVGWCAKAQLKQFFEQSMLLILPSYHEGLPMSLLEAMYAGIPCIATEVDGIPELIRSGSNGLLVEPGNIEQIKNSLLQLIQNKELRKEFSREGYQTVSRYFLLAEHIKILETLYCEILSKR